MENHLFDGLFEHSDLNARFAELADGRSYSYKDALGMSAQLANALRDFGAMPGDRIAVQVRKSIEAVSLYLACLRSGTVFLPLNTAYTPHEVQYFLTDSEAMLFVCDPDREEALKNVAQESGTLMKTLGIVGSDGSGSGSLNAKAGTKVNTFENIECGPDALAAILYTSGTTGRSKGAMLSHENLLSNARTLCELWQFSKHDVLLHALPIFHTHGLFVAINVTLMSGSSMIFLPGFDNDAVVRHLPSSTVMMGVPTFYTRLLEEPRFTKELATHMRLFVSGSAPLLAETHRDFELVTGKRILERYGMTETNMITSNPYDGERKAGTVGFPLSGVSVRICDPVTGRVLPSGEIGNIEVKGPNVFSGYWKMPEKTAEEFRSDGFFVTGDLGVESEDGYLKIVGRNKDLIISGGYNIYPKEIELLLDEQEGVLESAVVGVPHPDFGEGVVGVVVPRNATIDCDNILANMAGKLARYKQPKVLRVMAELPRNAMGKVQKNILREELKDTFGT